MKWFKKEDNASDPPQQGFPCRCVTKWIPVKDDSVRLSHKQLGGHKYFINKAAHILRMDIMNKYRAEAIFSQILKFNISRN